MSHSYKHHLFYGWPLVHEKISQLQEDMDYEPITPDDSFRLLVDREFKGYALYGTSIDSADDVTPFAFYSIAEIHKRLAPNWTLHAMDVFEKATGKSLDAFIPVYHPTPAAYIVTERC